MNILFICSEYPPVHHGGIGIVVEGLAEYFANLGHGVTVLGFYPDLQNPKHEIINGVQVRRLKAVSVKTGFGKLDTIVNAYLSRITIFQQTKKYIVQDNIDVIESHEWNAPIIYKLPVPMVNRLHGSNTAYLHYEGKTVSKMLDRLEQKTIKLSDFIISISKHTLHITEDVFKIDCPTKVIPNFIDDSLFKFDDSVKRVTELLYVGKYLIRKGMDELFAVVGLVLKQNEDCHFTFVGNISEAEKLYALSYVDKAFHNRVIFEGFVPHQLLPKYYNRAELFLMPSRAEGFGLTIIEAMACGCPVVVNNKASGPELVKQGETGILVEFEDFSDTANAIVDLVSNQDRIAKMRKACIQEAVSKYSLSNCCIKTLEVYNELVS